MTGMTPNSSLSSFCTPAQFVLVFDYRSFAQLGADNDVPLTESALLISPILAAKLQIASGKLEMAATRGARYDPINDLQVLVTPVNGQISNGGWALIEMVASMTAFEMYGRRYEAMPEYMQSKVDETNVLMEALENGEKIFPFTEAQQAGLLTDYVENAIDVDNRNMPTLIAQNFFGRRANRINGPGGSW
jgi:hypothetical protein